MPVQQCGMYHDDGELQVELSDLLKTPCTLHIRYGVVTKQSLYSVSQTLLQCCSFAFGAQDLCNPLCKSQEREEKRTSKQGGI